MHADLVAINQIMSNPIAARPDATVDSLVNLMTQHHVGCVPIVDAQNHPMGIVTKLDLIECQPDGRRTAREIMMPLALGISPDTTVAKAASLMSSERFHHLLVIDDERTLLGVVSTMDITRWLAQQQ
ncbi:MAG TPA: CBS domain-containing protein [Kofleriaceae bacterium]|nr:CBS domain-containing protein [Kofleriaceae bacterium]